MGAAMMPIALGAQALGGLASAAGAMKSANAQAATAAYSAQVAKRNADIQRENAKAVLAKGETVAEAHGLKSAAIAGAIKAGQGASGVDVNKGSNVLVQKSQRELANLDAQTIRQNAAREAWGYETAAINEEANAALKEAEAAYLPGAGRLAAGASLLSTVGSVGSKYAAWQT